MPGESALNPDAPPRRRSSFCRFRFWFGIAAVGISVTIAFFVDQEFSRFNSQSPIFQNQTLEEVKDRSTVVRPLIDENQRFDIAVSIWSLSGEEPGERMELPWLREAAQKPLYSAIVFRGLRLSDKHKQAVVTYQLPLTAL
jgi:hypothetical protein